MPESVLRSVVLILVEPQDQVNVAAAIRAMKNMGISRLRLVRPEPYDKIRLEGIAHDTFDIIDSIEHFDTVAEACSDAVRVAGFTARRRAAKREIISPRDCALQLLEYAKSGIVSLVFGREDRGLSNEDLDLAHVVVSIPTTEHASLNLAQAVLIALYEMHLAAADATRRLAPPRWDAPPATSLQYEQLFADAQRALSAIDFFKTRNPEHVMRSVRSLAYRASPDARESGFVRAMAIEVLRTLERVNRGPRSE